MILCDASAPDVVGGLYHLPYVEAVDGKRHGYKTRHDGVRWTRSSEHPADDRCPGCAEEAA